MAWKQVKVKVGKLSLDGRLEDDVLEMPYAEVGDSVKVDNKEMKVLHSHGILGGAMLSLNLAGASLEKEKKSDDESTSG